MVAEIEESSRFRLGASSENEADLVIFFFLIRFVQRVARLGF